MDNPLQRLREITDQVCSRLCAEAEVAVGSPSALRGDSLIELAHALSDSALEATMATAARGRAELDRVIAVLAGEAAKRSARELGHSGLAQRKGHRSAVQLVQSLTGESRGEAARQVKVGELLGETDAAERLANDARTAEGRPATGEHPSTGAHPSTGDHRDTTDGEAGQAGEDSGSAGNRASTAASLPWEYPITSAINAGTLSADSGHAILRVLGSVSDSCTDETRRLGAAEMAEFALASDLPLTREDLVREARRVCDRIDAAGVEERFLRRYERRSLKTWHDADGALHLHAVCDDASGVFIRQLTDIVLSPRRGGPRFTDPHDVEWAQRLVDDPRSNEQISFDAFLDVLRAGAACDDSTVFRKDRPAVRVITVVDDLAHDECGDSGDRGSGDFGDSGDDVVGVAELEGSGFAVPGTFAATAMCDCGTAAITIGTSGCILNFGRSRRQFSSSQREVLRARDGGCVWLGCDRPAWQTEAHHIRPWSEGGRTDVDDGVLLCRFHHLNLHTHGWRIVRGENCDYSLIPPAKFDVIRTPIPLRPKSTAWTRARSAGRDRTTPAVSADRRSARTSRPAAITAPITSTAASTRAEDCVAIP